MWWKVTGVSRSYPERTVTCRCGQSRITRAPVGIRVSCPGCGELFKVPAAAPVTTADSDRSAPGEALPPEPAAVVPATPRIDDLVEETAGEPDPPDVFGPPMDPPPAATSGGGTERGRVNGAKGGRARGGAAAYRSMIGAR